MDSNIQKVISAPAAPLALGFKNTQKPNERIDGNIDIKQTDQQEPDKADIKKVFQPTVISLEEVES